MTHAPRILTVASLAACLALGCGNPGGFDADACSGFTNTQALGLSWERFNHRVSLWDVRPTEGCVSAALEVGSIGGDFSTGDILSDTPIVYYSHRTVYGDRTRLGATPVTFEGVIGPAGRIEASETFTRDELNLSGYPDFTAVVRGLRYSTDEPYVDGAPELDYDQRLGWTMRGIGAGVAARAVGDDVTIDWWSEFVPAAAPDRPDHNAALPYAQVSVALDVVVVATNDVPVHEGTTSYGIAVDAPRPGSSLEVPRAPDESQLATVAGEPVAQPGFVGLRSFTHTFDIDSSCAEDADCSPGVACEAGTCAIPNGEYIRDMSFAVDLESYDPGTGEGVVRYDGYGSIATPIIWFHDQNFTTTAEWVWVQSGLRTDLATVAEPFQTGRSRWEL